MGQVRNDGTASCRARRFAPRQIMAAIPDETLKESCEITGIPERIWLRVQGLPGQCLAGQSPEGQRWSGQAPRIARSDSRSDPIVASTADGS